MKFCAVVAEYNPFHLGHLKQIEYIKKTLKAEKIVVFMSGNFTQRGEPALLNKFLRAKHAIKAGADCVIELPTVFATSNAETFCKGAIKLIDNANIFQGICFGVESGEKKEYDDLAQILNEESKDLKKLIKENLDKGFSLAKSKSEAVKTIYGDKFSEEFMSSPNNILGLEYTRALKNVNSKVEIFPMLREGNHNDEKLKKGITSASSIRNAVKQFKTKKTKRSLPSFVYKDMNLFPFAFDKIIMSSLYTTDKEDLKKISDCTEGLENRIKALSKDSRFIDELVEKVTTKRYTSSRIRRILISNLLGIKDDFVKDCLSSDLYYKVLAISKNSKDIISELSNANYPVLTRKSDVNLLKGTAEKCFDKDVLANDLYNLSTKDYQNENNMLII